MSKTKGSFSIDDGRLKLYLKGWTDKEIAEKMFLHENRAYMVGVQGEDIWLMVEVVEVD